MEEAIKKKNEMLASGADKLDRVYELARIMDGMEFTDLVSASASRTLSRMSSERRMT